MSPVPYSTGKCPRCHVPWKIAGGVLRVHAVPAGPETRVFMRCPGSGLEPADDPQTAW